MSTWADVIPLLALRAEELAATMLAFAVTPGESERPHEARRRALAVAARSRALAAAAGFAEGDEALAAAMELAQIEEAADAILRAASPETVRPPASHSGTFVVERRNASTNRLLAVRGHRAP